jgi:poly(hydroxyalkanoate) depolymerase family esterase
VLYPGQTSAANPMKCWNWFSAAEQRRDVGEPSLIADMTRAVLGEYAIDPARVFAAGLSAGGAACATLAATYPDLFAAIGVHSGLAHGAAGTMQQAMTAMRQGGAGRPRDARVRAVPTIVFHGDKDSTVHPDNGEAVAAQSLSAARCVGSAEAGEAPGGRRYTRTLHADAHGDILVEHWLIHGLAHAWAGGDAAGSFTDSLGPDATAEMLRFFHDHPMPAAL